MSQFLGAAAYQFDLNQIIPTLFIDNFTRAEATLYYHQNMLGDFIPNDLIEKLLAKAAAASAAPKETVEIWRTVAKQQGVHSVLPLLIGKPNCTGHTPITSALCSSTCDYSCDRYAKSFCAATSAHIAADVDYLDPVIIDGCSCIQSPFTSWVASLNTTASVLRIINNPPCLDGGRCSQYGYKTIEAKVQGKSCPMLCSNTYQIESNGGVVVSSGNTQNCTISATTNVPVVIINRQRVNANTDDHISVFDPSMMETVALVGSAPFF